MAIPIPLLLWGVEYSLGAKIIGCAAKHIPVWLSSVLHGIFSDSVGGRGIEVLCQLFNP